MCPCVSTVANVDADLSEMAQFLTASRTDGRSISLSTVSRTLTRLKLTRKVLKVVAAQQDPLR